MVEQRFLESEQKMANSVKRYNDVFRSGNKHSQPAVTPVVNTPALVTVPPKVSTPKLWSSPTHHALQLRHARGQLQDTSFPSLQSNYSTPGVVTDYANNFINSVLPAKQLCNT